MATTPHIVLTLMGDSVTRFPRGMITERISSLEDHKTRIFKKETEEVVCRRDDDQSPDNEHLIACFHTDQFTCVLEPHVTGVLVEAFPSPSNTNHWPKGVTLPRSGESGKIFIYLRSGDVVAFTNQQFKIKIDIDDDPHASDSQIASVFKDVSVPEVQVKSSNADDELFEDAGARNVNGLEESDDNQDKDGDGSAHEDEVEDDEDEDEDDEDDLDRVSIVRPSQLHTAPEILATPRPAEPTIKETPNHTIEVHLRTPEEQPYSTAQDRPVDPAIAPVEQDDPIGDPGSPSLRAQKLQHAVADSFRHNGMAAIESDEDSDIVPKRPVGKTYSNKNRKSHDTPRQSSPDQQLEQSIVDGDDDTADEELEVQVVEKPPSASKPLASRKRKLPEEEPETLPPEGTPEEKKPRLLEASDEESPAALEQEDEDEIPQHPIKRSTAKKSKLKRPQQPRSTQESEEIVLAASKASPRVVIGKSARIESPSSSAGSLTGKIPKILLSGDSTVLNAALKKWLGKVGASLIDTVPSRRTNFVCVVPKNHKLRSAKVLHSLAMNKLVVTDEWLTSSKSAEEILNPEGFLHDTVAGSKDRDRIFAGKRLFFTPSLVANYKTGWTDIKDIAREAGATEVDKLPLNKVHRLEADEDDDIVFFGADDGDGDASQLMSEYGHTVYSRELFTRSIISGELKPIKGDELSMTERPATKRKGRRS